MKTVPSILVLITCFVISTVGGSAQVPQLINYQGRVAVGGVNFDGTGQFKFALVNGTTPTVSHWSNDGTSTAGSEPTAGVSLAVSKGLYSVLLGDTTLANMMAVPASVFANNDVRLRIWFNDGSHGWQKLTPDQRLAAVGYAMTADSARTVPDGAITSSKIAAGAVGNSHLAAGAVGTSQIAAGAVGTSQLASGAVQSANIANGAVGTSQVATGAIGSAQLAAGALAKGQSVAAPTLAAAANTSYTVTGTEPAAFFLPASANTGDLIRISGASAGWSAAQPDLWTPRESTRAWRSVASSADGTKLVACVQNGLIYTSTDSGNTWTARESARTWRAVASSTDGTKLAACVWPGQIYTSTDSGVTWTARENARNWAAIASSADGTKLAACDNTGQIYTSTDSGVTWTARAAGLGNSWWYGIASSADGNKLVAGQLDNRIFTSTDSGATWTARDSSRKWGSIASSADGVKLVACTVPGQLYTSVDSGATWTARDSSRFWTSVASSADGSKLIACDQTGRLYTTTDSGITWIARESNRAWFSVASSADGTKLVAVVNGGQIYTSGASGSKGTTATFQYAGGGNWVNEGQTAIAAGVVGSAELSAGAVQSANIADGAVGAGQLAAGAVGSQQLAADLTISGTMTAAAFDGGGAGLTNLDAGQLSTGSVPDARLSGNVALRAGGNTFTGDQIVSSGNVGVGTATPAAKLDVAGTAKMTGFQLGTTATLGHVLTANASGAGTWQALPAAPTTLPPSGPAGGDLSGTYPNPLIAANAVTGAEITDGSVALADLAADSVNGSKIANGSVALADLATGSVDSSKIVDGSVALADLAADAVDSGKVADGTIAAADLASEAASLAKVSAGAMTSVSTNIGIGTSTPAAKLDVLGTAKVTGFQLGTTATAGHVLTANASGTGTWQAPPAIPTTLPPSGPAGGKLSGTYPNPSIAAGAVGSSEIADASVALADLAANSVNSTKVVDGSIALADLAANAVDSTKVVDGSLAATDLASDAASLAKVSNGRMAISGLNVGIGTATPSYSLHVNGTMAVDNLPQGDRRNVQWDPTTHQFYQAISSRRYKDNVAPLEDDFQKLLSVEPKSYTMKGDTERRREIGYIAEEIDELGLTNLVHYTEDGLPDALKYEKMVLYLVEIAKSQKAQIESLNRQLEDERQEVEARLESLERRLNEREEVE